MHIIHVTETQDIQIAIAQFKLRMEHIESRSTTLNLRHMAIMLPNLQSQEHKQDVLFYLKNKTTLQQKCTSFINNFSK